MEAKPMNRSYGCQRNSTENNPKRSLKKAVFGVACALVMALSSFAAAPVLAAEDEVQDTVEAAEKSVPVEERPVLVLDAGHGGDDPGAIDPVNDIYEADLAQHILDRLVPMLTAHKDELQLVVTHEAGENPSINQRAAVANSVGADLFVSLHLNAAERTSARGFSVYPTPPSRAYHEDSLRAAELLVGHVRETGIPVFGDESGIYYCFYRGSKKDIYSAESYASMNNISRGSFGVLDGTDCPSVLVEQWFVTNPDDMAMFANSQGKDLMALHLYRGLCEYFGIQPLY